MVFGLGITPRGNRQAGMESIDPPTTVGAADTALYIAGLAKELRGLASKADLGFLSYLLSMVESEAEETVKRLSDEGRAKTR
jgi:hypothetical protein